MGYSRKKPNRGRSGYEIGSRIWQGYLKTT